MPALIAPTVKRAAADIEGVTARTENGVQVLSVRDPNALTQAIGWLKFTGGSGSVLFRGQREIYPDLIASGFRGRSAQGRQKVSLALDAYVEQLSGAPCKCSAAPFSWKHAHRCDEQLSRATGESPSIISGTYRAVLEPLLQHYGLATRWLDVVDNIWVALWFACNMQMTRDRFAYHLRRSPAREPAGAKAYVVVIDAGNLSATAIPGYAVGTAARVVDLRQSVPSVYLRPHAQHGLLVAPGAITSRQLGSMLHLVPAVLEIELIDALEWLGTGAMASPFVLFPPAARDTGYRRLLTIAPRPPEILGQVLEYGPGY